MVGIDSSCISYLPVSANVKGARTRAQARLRAVERPDYRTEHCEERERKMHTGSGAKPGDSRRI
jgi:hypothetical protein